MFEPITDIDVPGIALLMNRAYRDSGLSPGWATENEYISGGHRTTADIIRNDLLVKPEALFLKWPGPAGNIVGCVWLEPQTASTWYLGSLTADPSLQNAGFGRSLLSSAEDWVRKRGGRFIRITVVNIRDTLIAWYQRRGYDLTGETEPFPYHDPQFGTPMRDDLCFVVLQKALQNYG